MSVLKLRCKLGWHQWTNWIGFPGTVGCVLRACKQCDAKQQRYSICLYAQTCVEFFDKKDRGESFADDPNYQAKEMS